MGKGGPCEKKTGGKKACICPRTNRIFDGPSSNNNTDSLTSEKKEGSGNTFLAIT